MQYRGYRLGGMVGIVLLCLFPRPGWSLQVTDSLRIDGFIVQGYLRTSHNRFLDAGSNGTFNFSAYALVMKSDVSDRFKVWSKLFGSSGIADTVVFDWAFGEYALNNQFHLKIGKVPMPIGIYNEIRDVYPILPTTVLPGFYADDAEFIPAEVKGLVLGGEVHGGHWGGMYSFYGGKAGGDIEAEETPPVENVVGLNFWVKSPIQDLRFGGSYFRGVETEVVKFREANYVASIEYLSPIGLNVRGEWGLHHEHAAPSTTKLGYYIEASYSLKERWIPLVRYDVFYPEKGMTSSITDYQKDWTIGLNYRFTDYLVWKVEEHFIHGVALLDLAENPMPVARWKLFAASVSFLF